MGNNILHKTHKGERVAWLIYFMYAGSCLIYVIYVCLRILVSYTYCVMLCFCFVFHRIVYPMLPIYLDCPFLIAASVFSNVYVAKHHIIVIMWFFLNFNLIFKWVTSIKISMGFVLRRDWVFMLREYTKCGSFSHSSCSPVFICFQQWPYIALLRMNILFQLIIWIMSRSSRGSVIYFHNYILRSDVTMSIPHSWMNIKCCSGVQ